MTLPEIWLYITEAKEDKKNLNGIYEARQKAKRWKESTPQQKLALIKRELDT